MSIKITIKAGTTAAQVFKEYMAQKEAFRKALVEGKATQIEKHSFAQPIPLIPA